MIPSCSSKEVHKTYDGGTTGDHALDQGVSASTGDGTKRLLKERIGGSQCLQERPTAMDPCSLFVEAHKSTHTTSKTDKLSSTRMGMPEIALGSL